MKFDSTAFRLSGQAISKDVCLSKIDILKSIIEKEMLFIDANLYDGNWEVGEYLTHVLDVVSKIERVFGVTPYRLSQWRAFYTKASPLEVSEFHIQQCKRKMNQLQRVMIVAGTESAG